MHFRKEGYRDGIGEGRKLDVEDGQTETLALVSWLLGENHLADVQAATKNPARRKEFFREFEQVQNSMSAKMTK